MCHPKHLVVDMVVVEMAVVALAMAERMAEGVGGFWCRVHHHPSYTLLSTDTVEHS